MTLRPVKIAGSRSKVIHLSWRGKGLCPSSSNDVELTLVDYGVIGPLCHHCAVRAEKMERAG